MKFDILTLFPDLIYNYSSESILGRAQNKGLIDVAAHNFRDFTKDKHRRVDDTPYGGGPGMVLQVQPIYDCLKAIGVLSLRGGQRPTKQSLRSQTTQGIATLPAVARNDKKVKVIIMDPAGKKFDERMAEKFSKLDRLVLICGRYEGFDARVYKFVDEKISVGDYVLAGGELPALTIMEAVSRLIPGVLGNEESLVNETFGNRKLDIRNWKLEESSQISNIQYPISTSEYPQYTRPEDFLGLKVPKVLLSGDHKKINEWRKKKTR